MQSQYGIYVVNLPFYDGGQATMSGVCLDNIASKFPLYPLRGKVLSDITKGYKNAGGNARTLPKILKSVGGEIDFMISIKYLRYYPKMIFQLPSGLTIYESVFENADGGRVVIGRPHKIFNNIRKCHAEDNIHITFFSNQYNLHTNGYQVNPDISLLGFKESSQLYDIDNNDPKNCTNSNDIHIIKTQTQLNQVEEAGNETTYRFINCRGCKTCKDHDQIEITSIKEEIEQDMINQSVHVDLKQCQTIANLPLMHDPAIKFYPNKTKALKVYNQQLKKLSKEPQAKEQVIQSEKKICKILGMSNLPVTYQNISR